MQEPQLEQKLMYGKYPIILIIPGTQFAYQELDIPKDVIIYHTKDDEYLYYASYQDTRIDVGRWRTFAEVHEWLLESVYIE